MAISSFCIMDRYDAVDYNSNAEKAHSVRGGMKGA